MITDEQLIEQIKRGKREAYGQLFSKYYERIYKICLSVLKNPQDAEDVVQETFIHSYLKLDQLKSPDKFFAWLKSIARNRSKKYLRRKRREVVQPGVVTLPQIAPDELLLKQELIDAIMEAIESLPEKDRMVIQSRIEGLNHAEISERFDISIEASMSRLYRARKKIAAHVKDLLYAIAGLTNIFSLKKIVSGGILAMKASTSAKYAVIVLGALGIMFASFIGVKSVFLSPEKNVADLTSDVTEKNSRQTSRQVVTVDKPSSVSTQQAMTVETKEKPRNVKINESKMDDEQSNEVTEALEFLDKLDKAAEDTAQNQKESDTSSVPTDKEMYLTGMELFKEKQYEEAVSVFDELVLQFTNSQYAEGATHLSGQASLMMRDYEKARAKFDELRINFPDKADLAAEAAYKSSFCSKLLGQDDEALRRYEQFAMNYPNSPYILATYFDMGTIYHKQGDADRAIENFRLALQHATDPALQAEIQGEIDRINIESARRGSR